MPQLGIRIEAQNARVLLFANRLWSIGDNGEGIAEGISSEKYLFTSEISFDKQLDEDSGEQSLNIYYRGEHLCSFSERMPDGVENTFNGTRDINDIANQLRDMMLNV